MLHDFLSFGPAMAALAIIMLPLTLVLARSRAMTGAGPGNWVAEVYTVNAAGTINTIYRQRFGRRSAASLHARAFAMFARRRNDGIICALRSIRDAEIVKFRPISPLRLMVSAGD